MQDPLSNIRTFLLANSYENIVIDGFVIHPNRTTDDNYNQINIQSEPSTNSAEQAVIKIAFGVYVKNKSQSEARNICKNIRNLLGNRGGKLGVGSDAVAFKKIWCVTEPYALSVNDQNQSIYMARFEAWISDTSINLSTYQ